MLVSKQIRAGRALVGMGQKELAELAGIAAATVRRMEDDKIGPERSTAGAVDRIRQCLESAGVEFTNDDAPGVRLTPKG